MGDITHTIEPRDPVRQVRLEELQLMDKRLLRQLVAQTFTAMGIRCAPVAAERLQAMAAAQPGDQSLSQTIVDLREE
jgi:hypothetical protein